MAERVAEISAAQVSAAKIDELISALIAMTSTIVEIDAKTQGRKRPR